MLHAMNASAGSSATAATDSLELSIDAIAWSGISWVAIKLYAKR